MSEAPHQTPKLPPALTGFTEAGPWMLPTRIIFRFGFTYLLLYALLGGNASILGYFPFVGRPVQNWISGPSYAAAQAIGQHWFHLSGLAATWHGGGSADVALEYVRTLCFLVFAIVGTVVWSVLDWRRPHYRALLGWLLFILRLTLGFSLLAYGLLKVFPLQMRYPGPAVLSDTYGNSSPFNLLWTLIGLHPAYECLCGAVEAVAGLLLFFQRTATVGALIAGVAVSNIVLYNYFFDVPLKLISAHMELFCFVLLIPNLAALWRFFFRGEATQLTEITILPETRPLIRVAIVTIQCVFLIGSSTALLVDRAMAWRGHLQSASVVPVTGVWQVDSIKAPNPKDAPASPDGSPWMTVYIENQNFGYYRSGDGVLWPAGIHYDPTQHELRIVDFGGSGTGMGSFGLTMDGRDHLTLSRLADNQLLATISLHRITPPASYTLTSRGFHWINETLYVH